MLRRLRLAFRCGVRRLGPLLAMLAALTALGFGAHAAADWHRHGQAETWFFHLHVHFGHHHHGEFGHRDDQSPNPDFPSGDDRESGTLTLALGVAPAPAVATAERPTLEADERAPLGSMNLTGRQFFDHASSPRGPPV